MTPELVLLARLASVWANQQQALVELRDLRVPAAAAARDAIHQADAELIELYAELAAAAGRLECHGERRTGGVQ